MSLIRVYPQHWFSPRNAQQPEQSFQPLDRLHHDIDRLFNGFFTPGWPTSLMDKPQADIRPSLDIHSDDKAYTIHMEVPGVDPDEVKVEVRDGMLTVAADASGTITVTATSTYTGTVNGSTTVTVGG